MNKIISTRCIFCKNKLAVGRTISLFCKGCSKKGIFEKMAAHQRDLKIMEGMLEYERECWGKEKVLKTSVQLSKSMQERCNTFSPQYVGFRGLREDVKEFNQEIPRIIKSKIRLRKETQERLELVEEIIDSLKKEIKKAKGKKEMKKLKDNFQDSKEEKREIESELKKLQKKK